MIAGPAELDLRLLARSIGTKAARMAPQREAERLTGLQVGGIGALALVNRPFEPCIERAALDHEWVLVNGGRRGLNLRVGVQDLIRLTGARVVDAVASRDVTPSSSPSPTVPGEDSLSVFRWPIELTALSLGSLGVSRDGDARGHAARSYLHAGGAVARRAPGPPGADRRVPEGADAAHPVDRHRRGQPDRARRRWRRRWWPPTSSASSG